MVIKDSSEGTATVDRDEYKSKVRSNSYDFDIQLFIKYVRISIIMDSLFNSPEI